MLNNVKGCQKLLKKCEKSYKISRETKTKGDKNVFKKTRIARV